ncbi:hypothetical protein JTE90_005622 [Oedothorax gibbosus]|uniref:Uncharacterized protein n=1 Tax=Oedothorax gibbosus TaxID=931172 RepID=A0AAV6UHD3_9ARAC|nr:hypothetical protein JTE90_005622 [Oedothorax gibbosus]
MNENKNSSNDQSPVKIPPADPNVDNIDDIAKESESKEDSKQPIEQEEKSAGGQATDPKSVSEKDNVAPSFRSVALQMLDKEHSWLREVESKSLSMDKPLISKVQFVTLSNNYKKFIDDLQDKNIEKTEITSQFTNLFNKFRICFVGQQRLQNKVYELQAMMSIEDSNTKKLKSHLFDLQDRGEGLQAQVEHLKKQVKQRDQEKADLLMEMSDLKVDLKRAQEHLDEQQSDFELTKNSADGDDYTSELEQKIYNLVDELKNIKSELNFSKEREVIFQDRLSQADQDKATLKTEMSGVKSDIQRQISLKEKFEAMVIEGEQKMEKEAEVVNHLMEEVAELKAELETSKSDYQALQKEFGQIQKEFDGISTNFVKAQRDVAIREERLKLLGAEKDTLMFEIKDGQKESKSLKVDLATANREQKEFARKISLLENNIKALEQEKDTQTNELAILHMRNEALEDEHKESQRELKELTKEREGLTLKVVRLEKIIVDLRSDIKTETENFKSVNKELKSSNLTIKELRESLKHQEQTKERIAAEVLELKQIISELKQENKVVELHVAESEKTINQLRQKLEDQITKYKKLADDKEFYRKSVADSKGIIEQQSDKLKMLDKYVEQLKSYNLASEDKQKKLQIQNQNTSKQLGLANESFKQEKKQTEYLTAKLIFKDNDMQSLRKQIAVLEKNIHDHQRKLKNVTDEKDAIGNKLREKDELISAKSEKVSKLEQDSASMKKDLEDKESEVKLLKIQLSEVQHRRELLESQVESLQNVKEDLLKAKSEIQKKDLLAKGLETEMQRPRNMHRWRILEGTDPDRSQLITKNQTLQKQMAKNDELLLAMETDLRQKEATIAKLREMLQRRMDDTLGDKLTDCRHELKARTTKLKCLTAENNMYENLVKKYRDENTALNDQLRKYKMMEFKNSTKKHVDKKDPMRVKLPPLR